MNLFAFILAYAALTALALAMKQHHRAVFRHEASPQRRRLFRIAGWSLLTFSIAAAVYREGWEMGVVAWFAAVSTSGFVLTMTLTYAPRLCAAPIAGLLLAAFLCA